MKLKLFEQYVRESLFAKWEIADEIEHNGYLINVYKKGDSEALGHPRPADEPETNNKELLIQRQKSNYELLNYQREILKNNEIFHFLIRSKRWPGYCLLKHY